MSNSESDYRKYRGQCRVYSEALVLENPEYRLVRGHYHCPMWGKEAHWWCVTPDGTIVDPTVRQFPTNGVGAEYVEFDGWIECEYCGEREHETKATIEGRFAFCKVKCFLNYVGI